MLYRALFFFLVFFITSCTSKKNILFIQNYQTDNIYEVSYDEYVLNIDDILKIDIKSDISEIPKSMSFDSPVNTQNINREALIFDGFKIDFQGFIDYPLIGKIKAKGKTISELKKIIFDFYTKEGILINPTIDVKLLNAHFTVLGEVNNPGRYNFIINNMDILQAIGIAGDLTINGLRKDVKLIRSVNGNKVVKSLDLTDVNFISSNEFQINSGDIIIVNPNNSKVKNAGIIGNSGTLISLLSFILSSIIVIRN